MRVSILALAAASSGVDVATSEPNDRLVSRNLVSEDAEASDADTTRRDASQLRALRARPIEEEELHAEAVVEHMNDVAHRREASALYEDEEEVFADETGDLDERRDLEKGDKNRRRLVGGKRLKVGDSFAAPNDEMHVLAYFLQLGFL